MMEYKRKEDIETEDVKEPAINYNKVYTYADYLKLEIDEMVEIIRGKIFRMSPAPKTKHQQLSMNILRAFLPKLKNKKCKIFHAPTDVVLPIANKKRNKSTTVVQPDICVICDSKIIEENAVFGVPDFVIEIIAGKEM